MVLLILQKICLFMEEYVFIFLRAFDWEAVYNVSELNKKHGTKNVSGWRK